MPLQRYIASHRLPPPVPPSQCWGRLHLHPGAHTTPVPLSTSKITSTHCPPRSAWFRHRCQSDCYSWSTSPLRFVVCFLQFRCLIFGLWWLWMWFGDSPLLYDVIYVTLNPLMSSGEVVYNRLQPMYGWQLKEWWHKMIDDKALCASHTSSIELSLELWQWAGIRICIS